jgi:hypothetical protein
MPLNRAADSASNAELEPHLLAIRALVDAEITFDILFGRAVTGETLIAG